MKFLTLVVVTLVSCFAATVQADKVCNALSSVRFIGPQKATTVARAVRYSNTCSGPAVRVTDGHKAAKDCSVAWYETEVDCFGTVQFKAFADCDKPKSVESKVHTTDCGKVQVKYTKITFFSGNSVKLSKNSKGDKVTVDY